MKMILQFLAALTLLFLGFGLLLYLFQDKMIFAPQPTGPGRDARYNRHAVTILHDGVTLSGWFFKGAAGPGRPLVFYYGGNAEDISLNFSDLERFSAGALVFMNYRGYGESGGRPTEKTLVADALFVFDHILKTEGVDPENVVLMGRSLGSGVAVQVAARRRVKGVVLVTPFDSLVHVAAVHYPMFPVGLLMRHRFDSAALAPGIRVPALFLTASEDLVVPVRLAENLEKVWGGPVTAARIEGTGHNDIHTSPAYWEALNAFLSAL